MLHITTTPTERRAKFRKDLASGKIMRFPGAFAPFVAKMLEDMGYEGAYIAGAGNAADLALPDIELTTLTEVSQRGYQIARATNLPTIIDVDNGFGVEQNAFRTAREIEALGICCMHMEDQAMPKRCGHLDNKKLISKEAMASKIRAATDARFDANFMVMARTDAREVEGLDKAIDRAKAYVDAGADAIFTEALHSASEFEAFRKAIDVPLLANMTEYGKSDLLSLKELEDIGYNLVIYPNTPLRIAMRAIEEVMTDLRDAGIQTHLLDRIITRKRLYEILDYENYNKFDPDTFNFEVPTGTEADNAPNAESIKKSA